MGYSAYQTYRCPRGYPRVPRLPTGPTRLPPNVYGFFTFREPARFGRRGRTTISLQHQHLSYSHWDRQRPDIHFPSYQSNAEPDEQEVYAATPSFDVPRITFRNSPQKWPRATPVRLKGQRPRKRFVKSSTNVNNSLLFRIQEQERRQDTMEDSPRFRGRPSYRRCPRDG